MNPPANHINKYLPAAVVYFFLNSFLLPVGLLYSTLLTPLLLLWVARYRHIFPMLLFFLLLAPFIVAHAIIGVDWTFYGYSLALSFSVFVFGLAFYQYVLSCGALREIFQSILLINSLLTLVALIAFPIPGLREIFWDNKALSLGIPHAERLKMLTYEPSYYSMLFAPVAIYYLLKAMRNELPRRATYCLLVLVPLFLSLSFGVILGMAISFLLLFFLRRGFRKIAGWVLLVSAILAGVVLIFPDNFIFLRLDNILTGKDSSFKGRTFDSFVLSLDIVRKRSLFWGTGFGQFKLLGLDRFRQYYNSTRYTIHDVVIPNSIGDLLGTLGLSGVAIKLSLEAYFFIKTRVFRNDYRLALFLFIFVYQFTGSFISNIAEYAIWILAFKPGLFPEFQISSHESTVYSPGLAV
ncbi:MAG TPA: O-antigen ligase family protein [Puia sp.]|jgi:hypothetical protein|nr:O-antigen ligase family protein [Puia sp.]